MVAPAEVDWRPIPGHAGYEASSAGEIRPTTPRYKVSPIEIWLAELVGEKIERRGQKIAPWINRRHRRDTACVALVVEGKRVVRFVHVLVCLAFHGVPPPELTDCCHIDHDSLNNRASNLKWDTHANNVAECWSEEAIERRSRWEDAIDGGPCYTGPDPRSDIPF